MGESEPCSRKLKVMGERGWDGDWDGDGVLRETLLFCAWKPTDTEGHFKVDLHTLNLETREISPALITMPPEVGDGFSAVVCRNHVYVLGGGGSMDRRSPDWGTGQDHVFCFDSDHPDHGWKQAPPMSVPRWNPTVVAAEAQGKIYAFMGSLQFGDVFDVGRSCWKLLSPPPDVDLDTLYLSPLLHYDSPRSRILCHFQTYDFRGNFPLYAYYVDSESWECLSENFGTWPLGSVLVDGLLYRLLCSDGDKGVSSFSDHSCPLEAYDVVENKWLPVNWSSRFPLLEVPSYSDIYHLGNDHFCLAWGNTLDGYFNYTKISISVHDNSGEIHATLLSESDSIISVPFPEEATCLFTCLK
ncbi:hypothetical protein V6N11_069545 [Hibiscus sabdariffa]|uniref:Uncharacterized protein n=1 Tax=Hibiscus sabdariffa TaxID=183260 RepID=A0ABR2Q346_9ROSI